MADQILVIDDVAINRIMLEVSLTRMSYQVRLAGAIGEIDSAAAKAAEVVIVASAALGDKPAAALARLRGYLANRHVPVLVITGPAPDDTPARVLQAGADDAMRCPGTEEELMARLRALLRRHRDTMMATALDALQPEGLAEEAAGFDYGGHVLLLSGSGQKITSLSYALRAEGPIRVTTACPDTAKAVLAHERPDVVILSADETENPRINTLLAEIRASRQPGTCALLVAHPIKALTSATTALDLGADDLFYGSFDPQEIAVRTRALLRRQASLNRMHRSLRRSVEASVTDPLTGLQNRRAAMAEMALLRKRAKTEGALTLVMIADVDHFKRINDGYGHAAGDAALIEVARRMRTALPHAPVMARIGGEEFLVALPINQTDDAHQIAETLRLSVCESPLEISSLLPELNVTISVGYHVSTDPSGPLEADMKTADAALYQAKSAGRNCAISMLLNAA
ncbi:MAG: diguanylate cyclase [Pseudomonadota bacterium]|nr:diguanylate cyclase [Pseudomonadota bacterium]